MSGDKTRSTPETALEDALRRIRVLERITATAAVATTTLDGVYGYNDAGFVVPGLTETAFPLTNVEYDSLGYWDPMNPGLITIQREGWYALMGWMVLSDGTILYALNGGAISGVPIAFQARAPDDFAHGVHIVHFDLGDTLTFYIGKASAGSESTTGYNFAALLVFAV